MTFIAYLAEGNELVLENMIDMLGEIAHVRVASHCDTQAEANRWLTLHDGFPFHTRSPNPGAASCQTGWVLPAQERM